jgi:3'-phosphoadenosine 5'-phosphosulfate sulfotransferase (PAPS reductase)/FAD synthetase
VQSSTCLLLAAHRRIPTFDAAIFVDTGWEPAAVFEHLDRRFASMPLFTLGPRGERGMARRQCTSEYKIKPIRAEVRRRLGHPHPARVPAGVWAQMAIGISLDEVHRARDADVAYMRNVFPLLDLKWRRGDCLAYLAEHGWATTPRSACVGCPFHTDAEWERLRRTSPAEWTDAVAFDAAIRGGSARANAAGQPLRGEFFLHAQRVPLGEARLRPRHEPADTTGCGPWTCPHAEQDPAAVEPGGGPPAVREVA